MGVKTTSASQGPLGAGSPDRYEDRADRSRRLERQRCLDQARADVGDAPGGDGGDASSSSDTGITDPFWRRICPESRWRRYRAGRKRPRHQSRDVPGVACPRPGRRAAAQSRRGRNSAACPAVRGIEGQSPDLNECGRREPPGADVEQDDSPRQVTIRMQDSMARSRARAPMPAQGVWA